MNLKEKITEACRLSDTTVKNLCSLIDMSETNMYSCFKRGSIETKHLEKVSKVLNISPEFWFSGNPGNFFLNNEGNLVANSTVKGNLNNSMVNEPTTKYESENANLRKEVEMLRELLAAKDETIQALKGK